MLSFPATFNTFRQLSTTPPRLFDKSSMVNHALFVTTFLRAIPQGVAARKGYEQVIAAGRVPGDTKGMAASAALPRVKTWREAVAVLDSGIANILEVDEVRDNLQKCLLWP